MSDLTSVRCVLTPMYMPTRSDMGSFSPGKDKAKKVEAYVNPERVRTGGAQRVS